MPTLGSLFDGAGTCPLAATLCGITPIWASEIEPFPVEVTKSRFPKMQHLGSVTEINGAEIEPVDIITFGSPCQDLSVAGKRAGLDGKRSNLFMEAVRIIKEMRCATDGKYPQFAMWENVLGAFSSNNGEDFRIVLEELSKIKAGDTTISRPTDKRGKPERWSHAGCIVADTYSLAWRVFDAQFWGVPQRRNRIYLVADFGGQCAGQILFERESLSRDITPLGRTQQAPTANPETSLVQHDCITIDHHPQDSRENIGGGGISQTLTSNMGTGGGNVPIVLIGYEQTAYDQYRENVIGATLKATGGNYGGGGQK